MLHINVIIKSVLRSSPHDNFWFNDIGANMSDCSVALQDFSPDAAMRMIRTPVITKINNFD